MNKIISRFILSLVISMLFYGNLRAQNNCQCWIDRAGDTAFHVVPMGASEGAPDYRNDDGSSALIPLAFNFCFWGTNESGLYINNNGNISFSAAFSAFTAFTFPLNSFDMVAPFWGDVDTENPNSGLVYYKLTPTYLIVQWDSVGYYSSRADKRNTFQCILSNGSDPIIPYGNNVQFCYKTMQWTTGGASSGVNGFDNSHPNLAHPATVGANKGDGVNFIQLGLFGISGSSYLGQFPPFPFDGISWLNNQSFFLNTCSNNLPPIVAGVSPCDTFVMCTGDTVNLKLSFLGIKSTDTIHAALSPPVPNGVSVTTNTPGNTDTMVIRLVGTNLNLGNNVVTVYGYNNEVPPDTTFVSFILQVDTNAAGTVVASSDTICPGDSTQLKIINNNTNLYVWSGSGQTTDSIEVKPTTTTTYSVTLTKGKCNSLQLTQTIVVRPLATLSITKDSICPGDSTMLTVTNGSAYLWSTGATTSSIYVKLDSSTTLNVIGHSPYCRTDTLYKRAYLIPFPKIGLTGIPTICPHDSALYTASGGLSYQWNNGTTTSSVNPVELKPLVPTTYTLTVTNALCSSDTVFTVNVSAPVAGLTPSSTICAGSSKALTATGGGTYKWSNNSTNSTITVTPSSKTTYSVTVTSVSGCVDTLYSTVSVDVPLLNVCCDRTIKQGDTIHLLASKSSSYVWNPATGLSCFNCPDPIATPTVTTTYTITGTDSIGCQTSSSITDTVNVICSDFQVPTVFTPNNDGINDDLVINVLNPSGYNISIMDRWGKQVFTSSNPADYWNGRLNGTDNLVPDGTYYYIIKASCGANEYTKKGFVELLGEK